jgi:hypothetical protein
MKIGESAPDFELQSITGEKVRLSSYFGKRKISCFSMLKITRPVALWRSLDSRIITQRFQKIMKF